MPFYDFTRGEAREFSLKELVAKITELERRRQVRAESTGEPERSADGRGSSGKRAGDYDIGQELTE